MNTKAKVTGLVLAIGAASVFALTPAVSNAAHGGKEVKCYGVNACKGKSSCKTANNACKGQNTCKGKGFVAMNAKQCDQVGGSTKP